MENKPEQRVHTPNDPAPTRPEDTVTPTYWEQTLRDFRRQKIAMVALLVIFAVVTIAVFCPLIANSRPYYVKMDFTDEYDEAYFIVLDSIDRLIGRDATEATLELDTIQNHLDRALDEMFRSLPPEQDDELRPLAAIFRDFAREPSDGSEPGVQEALSQFEQEFDLTQVALVPYSRFPAIRSLKKPEVFFLFLYITGVPLFLLRNRFRKARHAFLIIVVATVAGTTIWMSFFPEIQDTFPYRTRFESPGFEGSFVPAIVPYGENENLTAESRQAPTFLMPDEALATNQHFHLLGTDTTGRDVLSRMIYGARISMMIGIVAVSIYVVIGIILGALAGFYRGWIDLLLSRLIEIVICFPILFLILSVQAFLQPSMLNIMIVLGLVWWTGVARLQRGEFLRLVDQDFVQAVRAIGGSNLRIIFLHILPNALGPILIVISFGMAGSILVESALSFLGFGVPQPTASWGDLLNTGRADIQGTWWLTLFPGLAIFLTVTCFNLVGEGVRDALDPRRKH